MDKRVDHDPETRLPSVALQEGSLTFLRPVWSFSVFIENVFRTRSKRLFRCQPPLHSVTYPHLYSFTLNLQTLILGETSRSE